MLPASYSCATVTKMCPCGGLRQDRVFADDDLHLFQGQGGAAGAGLQRDVCPTCATVEQDLGSAGDPVERLKRG